MIEAHQFITARELLTYVWHPTGTGQRLLEKVRAGLLVEAMKIYRFEIRHPGGTPSIRAAKSAILELQALLQDL